MSERCILIVEAEELVRSPLAQYLRECGYHVLEAVNADEARRLLEDGERRVDIVLAEVGARGYRGFELSTWIKQSYPDIAVILAGTVAKATEKAGDLCDEGPVSKPYDHRIVLNRIRRLLAARVRSGQDD